MTEQQVFAIAAGYALAAFTLIVVLAIHIAGKREAKKHEAQVERRPSHLAD